MRRFPVLLTFVLFVLLPLSSRAEDAKPKTVDEKIADAKTEAMARGDSAWMLVSTGLVLFMVPGLALFYGGMVRRKNVLGTMMHSMVCLGLIGIQWVLFGYSLAFGVKEGGLWIGWDPSLLGLHGVDPTKTFPGTNIPIYLHCMYQGMFAIITPALISGAIAERIRFGPYCLFLVLWSALIYSPLAHWVWAIDAEGKQAGWLNSQGALDFAGGTVVHIAAGFSALAAILILRKRRGYPEHAMHPNSMVLTLTGAGMLWFGWFGFNGGSALSSNANAVSALTASQVAAAAAALSWMVVEWMHKGKPTALGVASGLVAGLVAVTPASGFVTPIGGLIIGVLAGLICYGAVCLKPLFKYDDSLDAFGVHGIGGFLGAVLTGVFASALLVNATNGNKFDAKVGTLALQGVENVTEWDKAVDAPVVGRTDQIIVQTKAAVIAAGYSFVLSLVLVFLIDKLWGFSLSAKEESEGLDRSDHGEVGFDLSPTMEMIPEMAGHEPRAATVPPNGDRRFTVVVNGVDAGELRGAWSELCGASATPPPQEFRIVYPYVTTVKGNRFNFRGGEPVRMRESMEKLFVSKLGGPVKAHVEDK